MPYDNAFERGGHLTPDHVQRASSPMTLPAEEQQHLEDNIATVAHHLGRPGARLEVRHGNGSAGLVVDPCEVLKVISRRLDRPAVTLPAEYGELVRNSRELALNEQSVTTKGCINRLCAAIAKLVAERDAMDQSASYWQERCAAAEVQAEAERERCAKIIKGRTYLGHYREWPEWGPGNRSNDDEITKFADAMARAICAADVGSPKVSGADQ